MDDMIGTKEDAVQEIRRLDVRIKSLTEDNKKLVDALEKVDERSDNCNCKHTEMCICADEMGKIAYFALQELNKE